MENLFRTDKLRLIEVHARGCRRMPTHAASARTSQTAGINERAGPLRSHRRLAPPRKIRSFVFAVPKLISPLARIKINSLIRHGANGQPASYCFASSFFASASKNHAPRCQTFFSLLFSYFIFSPGLLRQQPITIFSAKMQIHPRYFLPSFFTPFLSSSYSSSFFLARASL